MSDKLKIMLISSHYDQGGAARIVAYIHRELLRRGHESYAIYGRGKQPKDQNVLRIEGNLEVYASAFLSRFVGINGWWNHMATKKLIGEIERIKPDVIHLHVVHGYYLNMPMLFRYLNEKDIPIVWTFHDCHAFVGNCGFFYDCRKWEKGCEKCPYLKAYPTSQFFDFTKFMWQKKKELFTGGKKRIMVSPSQWLTSEAKKSFLGQYPCVTVRNGIDTKNMFYPRDRKTCREKYGYTQDEKLVLGIAVGYSDPRKGAKYIIEMAKALGEEAKVILIGWDDGNNAMLEGTTNIVALPPTPNADMLAEYYSMADVFVLPSLAENYATVSLESMACGTPVVGFMAGGIPEQLTEQKGIAVPAADGKAFTQAVRKALSEDNGLLHGEVLAKIIQRDNSVETMVQQYIEIYEKIKNQ